MAASESSTDAERRRPRRGRQHPVGDGTHLGGEAANWTGTGRGIPLVEVPRRIMAENTFVASETHFAFYLERFYNAVVNVNADQLTSAKDR